MYKAFLTMLNINCGQSLEKSFAQFSDGLFSTIKLPRPSRVYGTISRTGLPEEIEGGVQ